MAKTLGMELEEVFHERLGVKVLRLKDDVVIEPEMGDRVSDIILALQNAIATVLPFVCNCPPDEEGRATTHLRIAPIFGEVRDEVYEIIVRRIQIARDFEIKADKKIPAAIQVQIKVPYDRYPIWPLEEKKPRWGIIIDKYYGDLGI